MNPQDIYVIVAQAVIVGAFMAFISGWSNRNWKYLNKRDDELRQFIENQRSVDRKALKDVIARMEELTRIILACEKKNDTILAELMQEKQAKEK